MSDWPATSAPASGAEQPTDAVGLAERMARLEEWRAETERRQDRPAPSPRILLWLPMISAAFSALATVGTLISALMASHNASITAKTYEAQMTPYIAAEVMPPTINRQAKELTLAIQFKNITTQRAHGFRRTLRIKVDNIDIALPHQFSEEAESQMFPPMADLMLVSTLPLPGYFDAVLDGRSSLYITIEYEYQSVQGKHEKRYQTCRYSPKPNVFAIISVQ